MTCVGGVVDLGNYRGVGWCDYGAVKLDAGIHTFQVRIREGRTREDEPPSNEIWGAYDAFLLVPSDAGYTPRNDLAAYRPARPSYTPDLAAIAGPKVYWEGEAAAEEDFPKCWLNTDSEKLSRCAWLAVHVKNLAKPVSARYRVKVPESATYRFWVREFNKPWASPTDWRWDGGDWHATPRSMHCVGKVVDLGNYRGVGWCDYGDVKLDKGEHTLDIRVSQGRTLGEPYKIAKELWGAYDAFLLAKTASPPAAAPLPKAVNNPKVARTGYVPRTDIAAFRNKVAWLRTKKPTKPIYVNFTAQFYKRYAKIDPAVYPEYIREVDVVSYDLYPVTGYNRPDRVSDMRATMAAFAELAKGKPRFAIIENSDQDLAWTAKSTRGANGAEIRAMAWMTVIAGGTGLGWFPLAFNPFRWNNMNADEKEATAQVNREMASLADVILTGETLAVNASGTVSAAARRTRRGIYVFAVNLLHDKAQSSVIRIEGISGKANVLDESRSIPVENGRFVDAFDPLAVHLYLVPAE